MLHFMPFLVEIHKYIYELWRLHASLPKKILYFATSKW